MSARSMLRLGRGPRGFLVLALLAALVCWGLGLLLAPDKKRFFISPEWHYQPFYLAAHVVALQLFAVVYRRNYNAGIAHLEIEPGRPAAELTRIFGPLACILALIVAAPFSVLDYLYLYSDRYQRMGEAGTVLAIDFLMWGIWCAEWYLNALIWVVLLGFLAKNCWVILRYRFRSPIEVVLHERHYRPLLRMSAQGASILLGFSCTTVLYIWYTGGEVTDYVGLMLTGSLLVVGFVPPWLLLRSKISTAVRLEMLDQRRQLAHHMQRGTPTPSTMARTPEQRLDEILGMLRITYLEQRRGDIGQTEAKAVLVRLLAPTVTIIWQFRQTSMDLWSNFGMVFNDIAKYVARLGG